MVFRRRTRLQLQKINTEIPFFILITYDYTQDYCIYDHYELALRDCEEVRRVSLLHHWPQRLLRPASAAKPDYLDLRFLH